jgi:hypothetical protein
VTELPPPCGTRLAEVMVATNDSTSQTGASVPKVTTDPIGVDVDVSDIVPPLDPHPTIKATAKTAPPPARNTMFLLLILSSYCFDVVSIALPSMRSR